MTLAWLGCLLLAYAILTVAAHHVSLRMLFPRPPSSYGPTPEVFALAADDGTRIAARFWPVDHPRQTILWFHGNGEDLGTVAEQVEEWRRRGFAVFAIDYRGYGLSGGRPTEAATYADAAAALRWLGQERQVPASRIIVLGFSLGSGPAVEIATREPVAGLILLAPFVSAYRVQTILPLVPGDKFVNLRKIRRLRCPLLIIHGTDDRTVPFWHGQRLLAAATVRKSLLRVEGAGHGDLVEVAGDSYWRAIESFAGSLSEAERVGEGAGI